MDFIKLLAMIYIALCLEFIGQKLDTIITLLA